MNLVDTLLRTGSASLPNTSVFGWTQPLLLTAVLAAATPSLWLQARRGSTR